jgi:SAM-dependent methyltransferase
MSPDLIRHVLQAVIVVAALFVLYGQCRKPKWWLGRRIAMAMNIQHSGVTDWGLSHATIGKRATILDVGCGGGRTVQKLAAIATEGKVCGIDYSDASVAVARSTNSDLVDAGRVEIKHGSVSQLPYPDETFDVVTAVETHYYWPDFVNDLREVLRVLKPGGKLVLIAETYKGRSFDFVYRPVMTLLLRATYLTPSEHRDALDRAGFTGTDVSTERAKGRICAVGTKAVTVTSSAPARATGARHGQP